MMMAKRKCPVNIRCDETAIWLWQVALLMAEPDLSVSNQLRQCLLSEWVGPFWMPTFLPNTLFLCLCALHADLLLWESCVAFLPHYLCFSVLLSYESGSPFSWEACDFLRWMALERFDPGMSRFLLGMECIQCLFLFSQESYSTEGSSVSSA